MVINRRSLLALSAAAAATFGVKVSVSRAGGTLGDVFEIALENHSWTEPNGLTTASPEQLLGNPAAPFINSLVTPGNPNAANVSYETQYNNAGNGDHPSEPNYLWAEEGSNFVPFTPGLDSTSGNISTTQGTLPGTVINGDPDPSPSADNQFPASFAPDHLSGQLNAAGVSWKNYEEDYQITNSTTLTGGSPLNSKSGTSSLIVNPYNGSGQYNYAVKHNPFAFFADVNTENLEPISSLTTDLASNNVGKYNWITPNQYNDMHSSLSGSYKFTYNGVTYDSANGNNNDQESIAQGDNFLSIVVPEIEASQAFKNNGAIIIWTDETEGGDSAPYTLSEIVISPLAKGNAYASSVVTSHSSDIKTLEDLYNLPYINNPIPTSETFQDVAGQYATVPGANNLSDLFVPGTITPSTAVPEPVSFSLIGMGGLALLARRRRNA
jgi:phosphatidylinositol-3-phosphatase